MAQFLMDELLHRDANVEAGYIGGVRKTLRSVKAPLPPSGDGLKLDRQSVVLITGGARGITAATALELAEAFQPKLILVGRSPLPAAEDAADIAGILDPRQLRAALMTRVSTAGQRPTPALIEGIAKRILIDREIRQNLALLRSLGSEVEYHAGDVADAAFIRNLIEATYRKHGRIDGVVHGAGLIEDKLIADKKPDSFDRVVRPKMAGALALAGALRPEKLQFTVFFSSVSARYGNRGQSDYAAANDFLNKLAVSLNRQWPGRVVSLNWGPWKTEGGMVSDELAARFAAASVELIEPRGGRKAFLAELTAGPKQDAEVVFGGPLSTDPKPAGTERPAVSSGLPLIDTLSHANGSVLADIESHPERHVFLQDHCIDGKPVLPMVVAMEMLAETAVAGNPGKPFTAVRNLRNFQGITYPNGSARELQVEGAKSTVVTSGAPLAIDLALKSRNSGQIHYRSRVEFGGTLPALPPRLQLRNRRPFPLSLAEAYDRWLFHGPLFAGIVEVVAMGDNGIIGRLKTTKVEKMFRPARGGAWLVDPVITDSSLQLALLWTRAFYDQTALPSMLEAYYHVEALHSAGEVLCEIEIVHRAGSPTLRCRHVFYDEQGHVLGWMEGMESTMSKSLNRISEKVAEVR